MVGSLFRFFLLVGSEWVLWILLGCSILGFAVFLERWRSLRSMEVVGAMFWNDQFTRWLAQGVPADWRSGALELAKRYDCVETKVLLALSRREGADGDDLDRTTNGIVAAERIALERYLGILGTLGNSAPFIGLFGTVLGIIKAFSELDKAAGTTGLTTISGGLAEALVTTAAGLFVAIPSVMTFNFFQKKIKTIIARSNSLAGLVIGSRT